MKWKKIIPKNISLKKIRLPHRKKSERDKISWKQVKTACIFILLACNIVLLAITGVIKGYSWYLSNQARKQIDMMLAERGILCGSSVYRTLENCPQAYILRTDSAVEKAFAEALLTGEVSTSTDKGNVAMWVGENGTVSWGASGEVRAEVTLNSIPEPQTIEQAQSIIEDILKNAGIETRHSQFTASQEAEGNFTVEVEQELDKTELIGCGLTVVIASGNEVEITGKWCTGSIQPVTIRALSSYSPAQMIFTFIAGQNGFSQIVSAQPVYLLSDRSGGRFTAIPCWRFSTENDKYILNIVSGDVVGASQLDSDTGAAEEEDGETEPEVDPSV